MLELIAGQPPKAPAAGPFSSPAEMGWATTAPAMAPGLAGRRRRLPGLEARDTNSCADGWEPYGSRSARFPAHCPCALLQCHLGIGMSRSLSMSLLAKSRAWPQRRRRSLPRDAGGGPLCLAISHKLAERAAEAHSQLHAGMATGAGSTAERHGMAAWLWPKTGVWSPRGVRPCRH